MPCRRMVHGRSPSQSDCRSMATEANIEETDDEYIVELDLPGVKREDVNVKTRDSELRVSGEIREKRSQGDIGAPNPPSRRDGLLTVRLGTSQARQARKIEIKSP